MNTRQSVLALVLIFSTINAYSTPTAASLNLCADSILLEVAAPKQILSVSWLATDPGLSNYAELAARYPNNRGRIEELVPHAPDFVFTGTNTSAVDDALLDRLGYEVVRLRPDNSLDDYKKNLLLVGALLERAEQARRLIQNLDNALQIISKQTSAGNRPQAIIFQANGYSPGIDTLPFELMTTSGLNYVSKAYTEWPNGRFLSVEELFYQGPEIVVLAALDLEQPALADLYLNHPALTVARNRTVTKWRPMVVHLHERHFNCGSQYVLQAIETLIEARKRFLATAN